MSPIDKALESADEADGPTLQAILDAVMVRNEALERLSLVLAANTAEMHRIQVLLDTRPTKEDVSYHRRKSFAVVVLITLALVFGLDQHTEQCGPGAEAKKAIAYVLDHPGDLYNVEDLRKSTEGVTPFYCTITVPIHVHDDSAKWPNNRVFIGLGLYGVLFAGLVGWVLRSRKRMVSTRRNEKGAQPYNRRASDWDTETFS